MQSVSLIVALLESGDFFAATPKVKSVSLLQISVAGQRKRSQLLLVTEGVKYYNSLTAEKKKALPYFPNGFTGFDAEHIVAGFKTDEKRYLAVWCLRGSTQVQVRMEEMVQSVNISYPSNANVHVAIAKGSMRVDFEKVGQAVFLELKCSV